MNIVSDDQVIDVYKASVDATLVRENLKKTAEERIGDLQRLVNAAEELRRAGRNVEAHPAAVKPSNSRAPAAVMGADMPQEDDLKVREASRPYDAGVDRSTIRALLKLSPAERARLAVDEARNLEAFDAVVSRQR